ncbi:hypothetical protein AB0A63_07075 [Lentzea sp. NPDC042327]|uniref:hypothetical protein n=1 Tax=Lentzea sp. NPDC042327 TaxID=3154801 RepID=UPI00340AFAF7
MFVGRLDELLGSVIAKVRRVNYVRPGGHREAEEGPIELTLENGAVLLFESGSDGESLRLSTGEWADPFAGPLSPENQDFVARSGKWTAFDVSSEGDYRELVGRRVEDISLVVESGKTTGVELSVGSVFVRAVVVADELTVVLGEVAGRPSKQEES